MSRSRGFKRKAEITVLCFLVSAACGCAAAPSRGSGSAATPAVKAPAQQNRVYHISRSPGDADITRFTSAVDSCYSSSGGGRMTYAIAPSGAANPFSDAEVRCISETVSSSCGKFLDCLEKLYTRVAR